MIELTLDQHQALERSGPKPVRAVDPTTRAEYVLVPAEVYARLEGLLGGDTDRDHEELRVLLARSAEANGWNEPEMDAYDHYDENRR